MAYLAAVLFALSLVACGAHYSTRVVNGVKKVYYVDEEGNATLVYEVDRDGNTTVYDENDPMYKRHKAWEEKLAAAEADDAARQERIRQAPKRRARDPIYVTLLPTRLDDALEKGQKEKGAVFGQLKKEFASDPVIRLVDKGKESQELARFGRLLSGTSPNQAPDADVVVESSAYVRETVGFNRKTGKPGTMVAVVFEATITSNFLNASYKVEESGNIFRNAEVTRRFAEKIKKVIKTDIGPTIPKDRSL